MSGGIQRIAGRVRDGCLAKLASIRLVKSVSIHDAKTNLSRLIAAVEAGEEVVLRRRDEPVARLVAYEPAAILRRPGALRGAIELAPDFDETPEEFGSHTG